MRQVATGIKRPVEAKLITLMKTIPRIAGMRQPYVVWIGIDIWLFLIVSIPVGGSNRYW
jgi:hypothetical protein